MIFTTSTNVLKKQLQIVAGAVSSGSVIPILNDYVFRLEVDTLSILASDMDVTIETCCKVEQQQAQVFGSDNGAVTIPAKMLNDVIKSLPEQTLKFDIDTITGDISITGQKGGKYKLLGSDPKDFPEMVSMSETNTVTVNSDALIEATKTLFATANSGFVLQPAMRGVFFSMDKTGATFVATNGSIMMKNEVHSQTFEDDIQMVLPRKALDLLKNMLPSDNLVNVAYNLSHVMFEFDNIKVKCLLIESKFPNYKFVLDQENDKVLTLNRKEFIGGIKRATVFANTEFSRTVLNLSEGNVLNLNTQDAAGLNQAKEWIACEYVGAPLEIAFNSRYLLDVISAVETEDVCIKMITPHKPAMVFPVNASTVENMVILIMPIANAS